MASRPVRDTSVLVLLAVASGAISARLPLVLALFAPAALGLFLLTLLVYGLSGDDDTRRRLLAWTIGAFAVHIAFGLAWSALHLQGPDAALYDSSARDIVDHWTRGLPFVAPRSGKEGFFYMLAVLYRVFGPHPQAGVVVNSSLAAALVPIMSDVTRRLFGPSAERFMPPLLVLVPSFLIWTSQLLREAGVLFLLAVAVSCVTRLTDRIRYGPLALLAVTVPALFTFRANVAMIVAGGLVLALMAARGDVVSGMTTGIGALVLATAVVVGLGLGYSGYQALLKVDLNEVNTVRSDLSTSAQSGFLPNADVSTTPRALAYLPAALVSFFLGPFPWQLRSGRQLLALPDVVVWWLLLPSLWRGLRKGWGSVGRRVLPLLVPAVLTSAGLALILSNFGAIVRERMQVILLLLPFVALGLAARDAEPISDSGSEKHRPAGRAVAGLGRGGQV